MADVPNITTMSKRQFVKCCLFGVGGCVMGFDQLEGYASTLDRIAAARCSPDELWKWSIEAQYYDGTPDALVCRKCPHGCVLEPGDTGRCRNRVNYKGKMYSIAYGNPCAVHIDPIEKKPLYHFLPSTQAFSIAAAGCNLSCLNCQNWEISQVSPKETRNYDLMPAKVVEECLRARCDSIAYTYSEPTTFYEYAYDTAKIARENGVRNVWKSSGYINEQPLRKLCRFIDAANIDLKSFDDGIYVRLNGATLEPVLRTLKIFHEEGVWLEITNLVIPTWTDKLDMVKKMCDWLYRNELSACPLHFSRFTPMYKLNQLPSTPVSMMEKAREIALKAGMKYVYIGNVPGHAAENTYCPACGTMIVERKGFKILGNKIVAGKCSSCGETIAGVWQ